MKLGSYTAGNMAFDATVIIDDEVIAALPTPPDDTQGWDDRVLFRSPKDLYTTTLFYIARAAYAQQRGTRGTFLAPMGDTLMRLEYRVTWSDLGEDDGTFFTVGFADTPRS